MMEKWILERKGTDYTDERKFETEKEAQDVLREEYEETLEDYCSPMDTECDENYAYIKDEEYYQSWNIYKEKTYSNKTEELIDKISRELDKADIGVDQYAFELMDTSAAKDHIWEAQRLLRELEELVK